MASYWREKACLITGGSAGLGFALGAAAVDAGASVLICGRDRRRLEASAKSLRGSGERSSPIVETVAADVTREDDCQRLVEAAKSHFGGLDLLVNCAGVSGRRHLLDVEPAEFERFWAINFLAPVRLTRMLSDSLIERRGHVVNIGSLASKAAARYMGAYPASKFALAAYTQQLRLELGPRGLHALLVCPGPIARDDAGARYQQAAADLPAGAQLPAAGARLSAIEPAWLSRKILRACEKRRAELVVPLRARLLFAVSQLSPSFGDWLLTKFTSR